MPAATNNLTCPVCATGSLEPFLTIDQVPVHCNLLWSEQSAALQAEMGNIQLVFCDHCGHVFNSSFDPSLMEYNQVYENSLHFSPRFQSYAETLAKDLVDRYQLYNKKIIELGSGQGDFLRLLCDLGNNQGYGFDAAYVPDGKNELDERLTFIQDFEWQKYIDFAPDMIYTRHVLEHIENPFPFVTAIRQGLYEQAATLIFMEMPNMAYTLKEMAIWDIIYEHCGYYTPNSLAYLFQRAGFEILAISDTFGGQFLTVEARPQKGQSGHMAANQEAINQLEAKVMSYAEEFREKVSFWRGKLADWKNDGRRVAVWGAGSKGVSFLNALQAQEQIQYIVDINPRKKGMFVVGSGQKNVPPEFMKEYQPDVVILMNPLYQDEIAAMMSDMGLTAEFFVA